MAKAAKAPAKKTSPVVWIGLVAAAVAVYIVTTPSDAPIASTAKRVKKKTTAKNEGLITQADYDAFEKKFPPVVVAAVDAFNPLVKKQVKVAEPIKTVDLAPGATQGIPVTLTNGEQNWYVTGCPALNGVREALLENTVTGETEYVRPGDTWKGARVTGVDVSVVTMVGTVGGAVDVPIIQPGETPGATPKTAVASNAPLTIPSGAISGAIGAGTPANGPRVLTLSNGSTIQLPLPDANGQTNTNNDGNGRRRRRNRNQNSGNSNNGF